MIVFERRSLGYKVGLTGIVLSALLFLIGFASPYWLSAKDSSSEGSQGLWMACVSTSTVHVCDAIGILNVKVWFHIVRLLETVGMLMLVGAALYGIVVNVRTVIPRHTKSTEGFALIGGIVGFLGAIVYLGMIGSDWRFNALNYLGWAFYLTVVGSGGAFVASIVVCITDKPLEAPTTESLGMANVGGFPSAVVVQRGRVQSAYPCPGSSSAVAHTYAGPASGYSVPPPQARDPSKS